MQNKNFTNKKMKKGPIKSDLEINEVFFMQIII